uniref:Nucleotide kinase n=1 Tax=candidate division WOR-3 bacterium TaxID=2052148 RepID=A0A7C4Y4K0_UNCW3
MIYIITGEKNAGKTRYIIEMIKSMKRTDGFITVKNMDKGKFVGYNIMRVLTGEKVPFIRYNKKLLKEDDILLEHKSKMFFLKKGYNFAKKILFEAKKMKLENFIIDEIGELELEGKVFSEILEEAINSFNNVYITVRSDFVDKVIKKFKIKDYKIITIERREDDRLENKKGKQVEDSKEVQGEGNNNTNIEGTKKPSVSKRRNKK